MQRPDLPDRAIPAWMHEVTRLATHKTQLYLHGNVGDQFHYPFRGQWVVSGIRDALFALLAEPRPGYRILAAYDLVDGMTLADELRLPGFGSPDGEPTMSALLEELVGDHPHAPKSGGSSTDRRPESEGRGGAARVGPLQIQQPWERALGQIRTLLANDQYPCAIVVEYASQLVTSATSPEVTERSALLRQLKAAREARRLAAGAGADAPILQNLLLVVCNRLQDLPPWLYVDQPFVGTVHVGRPTRDERRYFLQRHVPERSPAEGAEGRRPGPDVDELARLTEDFSLRDLFGLRELARRHAGLGSKELTELFRYGARHSEWDSISAADLKQAEAVLRERVKGQEAAVAVVADRLRVARLGLSDATRVGVASKPRAVLFFAGPTGVGKTEMAKAICSLIFGSEDALVRFDMSEYQQDHSDQRLLGAPPGYVGYEAGGELTNRMKESPFRVLLFDEIEKAHRSVLDKFLQVLDDGRLTSGLGETVYFSDAVIVFTSNAGMGPMVDSRTGKAEPRVRPDTHKNYEDVRPRILRGVKEHFERLERPEILNRIGRNVVVFDFVREPVMKEIVEQKTLPSVAANFKKRLGIDIEFAPAVARRIVERAMSEPERGARGLEDLVHAAVVNPLVRMMSGDRGGDSEPAGKRPISRIRVTDIRISPAGEDVFEVECDAE